MPRNEPKVEARHSAQTSSLSSPLPCQRQQTFTWSPSLGFVRRSRSKLGIHRCGGAGGGTPPAPQPLLLPGAATSSVRTYQRRPRPRPGPRRTRAREGACVCACASVCARARACVSACAGAPARTHRDSSASFCSSIISSFWPCLDTQWSTPCRR